MKRFLTLLLVAAMLVTVGLTATAEVPQTEIIVATAADYPHIDLSEHKTVNFIVITDVPQDYSMIMDHVNARLESEFNTTLEFTLVKWSEYQQLYPLMMSSGEAYDMAWMLPSLGLYTYLEKEYLTTIDMEFIETYMPYSFKYQSKASWDQVTYNGRLVGIPQGIADAGGATDMIAVRNDMLEKYGYETINTWDDIRGIWMDIAADTPETGMLALAECKTSAYGYTLYSQAKKVIAAGSEALFTFVWKDGELPTPEEVFFQYDSAFAKDAFAEMKVLADAGVWSRSTLSNTTLNYTTFSQGAAATGVFNGSIYWYVNELRNNLGVESTVFVIGQQTGDQLVLCENYSQNTFSFYAGSPDIARAAMVMDILKYDTDLNHTFRAGILGYHYTEDTPGVYMEGEHVMGWQKDSFCITWNIKNGSLKTVYADDPDRQANQDWMDVVGVVNPTAAFVYDGADVQPQIAAVKAVVEEHRGALRVGLVDDVDAAYANFLDLMQQSGLQAYVDDYIGQYAAWYESVNS